VITGNKFITNVRIRKSIQAERMAAEFSNKKGECSSVISSRLFKFVKNLSARGIRLALGRSDFPAIPLVLATSVSKKNGGKPA
jgi:hypothetical protein